MRRGSLSVWKESKTISVVPTWSAIGFIFPKEGKRYENSYGRLKKGPAAPQPAPMAPSRPAVQCPGGLEWNGRRLRSSRHSLASTLSVLDDRVAASRPLLEAIGILITDRSNRSCFDRSGYPYCLWHLRFERSFPHGSEVARASAELEFVEPWETTQPREVVARSLAEIFQIGKQSRIAERTEQRIPAEEAGGLDVAKLVVELINDAVNRLRAGGVTAEKIEAT